MEGRLSGFVMVILLLHILFWVCTISRPLAPNPSALPPHQGTAAMSPLSFEFTMASKQGDEMMDDDEQVMKYGKGVHNIIGSSPPNCEHKCFGCSPCQATQVPTISRHVGIQYTNYEPEGWKCKCGPVLYSP